MAEPIIARKSPYAVEVEAGKTYHWCACGRSKAQPFCDGSHKGTGLTPLAVTPDKTGKSFFCGCKRSGKGALCDGTHKSLP
jgi:CDGSH-type Zn-finger protein